MNNSSSGACAYDWFWRPQNYSKTNAGAAKSERLHHLLIGSRPTGTTFTKANRSVVTLSFHFIACEWNCVFVRTLCLVQRIFYAQLSAHLDPDATSVGHNVFVNVHFMRRKALDTNSWRTFMRSVAHLLYVHRPQCHFCQFQILCDCIRCARKVCRISFLYFVKLKWIEFVFGFSLKSLAAAIHTRPHMIPKRSWKG